MTNVAPQWQEFNAGNWAAVENAVKQYVQNVGHLVYVFTGTGKFTAQLVLTYLSTFSVFFFQFALEFYRSLCKIKYLKNSTKRTSCDKSVDILQQLLLQQTNVRVRSRAVNRALIGVWIFI